MATSTISKQYSDDAAFILGDNNCSLHVKRRCGIVSISRNYITAIAKDTNVIVGTLPSGYRPAGAITNVGTSYSGDYASISVEANGQVTIRSSQNNYLMPLNITYIAEQ